MVHLRKVSGKCKYSLIAMLMLAMNCSVLVHLAIDLQQVKLSQKACVTDSHFNFTEDGNGLGTKHLVTVISTGV